MRSKFVPAPLWPRPFKRLAPKDDRPLPDLPADERQAPSSPEAQTERARQLAGRYSPNIRLPDWGGGRNLPNNRYGSAAARAVYPEHFWLGVLEAEARLAAQPTPQLAPVLRCLAHRRQVTARLLGHAGAAEFGRPLGAEERVYTRLDGTYSANSAVRRYCRDYAQNRLRPYRQRVRAAADPASGIARVWTTFACLPDGTAVPLSELYCCQGVTMGAAGGLTPGTIGHLETLFAAACRHDAGLPFADVCGRIGRLHWWLVQSCPFARGTAAIADMLSASLFARHGYRWQGWGPGISADLTALCTPDSEAFVAGYAGMLRRLP